MSRYIKTVVRNLLFIPLRILDWAASGYSRMIESLRPSYGLFWVERQANRIAARRTRVTHSGARGKQIFDLYTPNSLCFYRADSFSTKEPETLAWIDRLGGDGPLFDIGANVGLYSIYYARTKGGCVYAFEPSVFNLALLVKNISINGLASKIRIVPTPLSSADGFGDFTLQMTTEGGALSSFDVAYGQDGKPLNKVLSYMTPGFTLDSLLETGMIREIPRLVKVDVDGIEHLILKGAVKTISHPECVSILVEVNRDFAELASNVNAILTNAGFSLEAVPANSSSGEASSEVMVNQIWIKA